MNSFKVNVIIEKLDNKNGFIVTCIDGREFIVASLDEAIKLKEQLDKDSNDLSNI